MCVHIDRNHQSILHFDYIKILRVLRNAASMCIKRGALVTSSEVSTYMYISSHINHNQELRIKTLKSEVGIISAQRNFIHFLTNKTWSIKVLYFLKFDSCFEFQVDSCFEFQVDNSLVNFFSCLRCVRVCQHALWRNHV